jgi:hypothetical protein
VITNLGSADTYHDGGMKAPGVICHEVLEVIRSLRTDVKHGIFIGGCAPPNSNRLALEFIVPFLLFFFFFYGSQKRDRIIFCVFSVYVLRSICGIVTRRVINLIEKMSLIDSFLFCLFLECAIKDPSCP